MQIPPQLRSICLGLGLSCIGVLNSAAEPWFEELSSTGAPDFIHFNGMSGEYYFVEMTGQGGTLLDYDNDGDLDLYLVQGAMLGKGKTYRQALMPPRLIPPRDRLHRNDLVVGADGS